MTQRQSIWNRFCEKHHIEDLGVPLFQHDSDLRVKTKSIGKACVRSVLTRSSQMDHMIHTETDLLIQDWESGVHALDGLIYMMFLKKHKGIIPLYIGKTETFGKSQGNLSVNIKNIHRDTSKFARWGDNYAYHIGDLSAAILPDHSSDKINPKYEKWANTLFVSLKTNEPQLKEEVYFWAKAWNGTETGIWTEFGPTRLTFLEYLLIGVASAVFPGDLLNQEGQSR